MRGLDYRVKSTHRKQAGVWFPQDWACLSEPAQNAAPGCWTQWHRLWAVLQCTPQVITHPLSLASETGLIHHLHRGVKCCPGHQPGNTSLADSHCWWGQLSLGHKDTSVLLEEGGYRSPCQHNWVSDNQCENKGQGPKSCGASCSSRKHPGVWGSALLLELGTLRQSLFVFLTWQGETRGNPLTAANSPCLLCSVCQCLCGYSSSFSGGCLCHEKSLLPSNTRLRGSLPHWGEPGWDAPLELRLRRAWKSLYRRNFIITNVSATAKNWPLRLHSFRIYLSFSSYLSWLFSALESHPKEVRGRLLPGFESGVAGGGRQTAAHLHPKWVSVQHWLRLLMGLDPAERGLMSDIATKHISLSSSLINNYTSWGNWISREPIIKSKIVLIYFKHCSRILCLEERKRAVVNRSCEYWVYFNGSQSCLLLSHFNADLFNMLSTVAFLFFFFFPVSCHEKIMIPKHCSNDHFR